MAPRKRFVLHTIVCIQLQMAAARALQTVDRSLDATTETNRLRRATVL